MSKKDDIIAAAVVEFGENSYDAASINKIIKASGTSKGTFYHYFSDKKALYCEIIDRMMALKKQYLSRMMVDAQQQDFDLFEMLKNQVRVMMEFTREHPEYYQFGMKWVIDRDVLGEEMLQKYVPDISESFSGIVELGIKQGDFSKKYPPKFISRMISYIMMNYYDILFDNKDIPSMDEIEQNLDLLFDFLKKGFS